MLEDISGLGFKQQPLRKGEAWGIRNSRLSLSICSVQDLPWDIRDHIIFKKAFPIAYDKKYNNAI